VKEFDYIIVSDLARVRVMEAILHEIVSGSNPHIDRKEWLTVKELLCQWRERMFSEIEG